MGLFKKKPKNPMKESGVPETDETASVEMSLVDAISPSALQITSNYLQIGERFARTFFVITYPRFLTVNWLSPVINLDRIINISMFIHPADTGIILKKLRRKLTQVEAQIAQEAESGKIRDRYWKLRAMILKICGTGLSRARKNSSNTGSTSRFLKKALTSLMRWKKKFFLCLKLNWSISGLRFFSRTLRLIPRFLWELMNCM